jgi:hypothetical protein
MDVPEVIASPGRRRPPRPPSGWAATRREATVAAAAVGAGFAVAVTTVPAAPTPQRVAESFVQAMFEQDWPAAWTVLCRSDRDSLDYDAFARGLATLNGGSSMPSDVDLEVDDPRPARGPARGQLTVKITATSDDLNRQDWAITGDVPLIVEDGRVRVCFTTEGAGP